MRYSVTPTTSAELPTDLQDKFPQMGQGTIKLASNEDIIKDEAGMSSPNLHRRIDLDNDVTEPPKVAPDEYTIGLWGTHSYRTITHQYHDENSTSTEVP